MTKTEDKTGFRQRFRSGDHLVGTFVKTPVTHVIEIIGAVGFDFVVIDEEHAPWDRVTIDAALLAARASGTAGIVRVAEPTPSKILSVLDDGAAGVLVPHVYSAKKAQEIAAACRYRGGKRGFSNTTRAGGYGAVGLWDHVAAGDENVTLIGMIEDPEALDEIDAIVATEGLDGVFIGRGDLTVAMGAASTDAPEIKNACTRIIAAARNAGKPVAVMVGTAEEAARFREMGASAFIVSSDQTFMRQAAMRAFADVAAVGRS
ncbi:HpcH/HpaI aldolase family protein [Oryzicola mucosus]|nr:aldolase/citrate lyase family protein [Oryzicola mucosus]